MRQLPDRPPCLSSASPQPLPVYSQRGHWEPSPTKVRSGGSSAHDTGLPCQRSWSPYHGLQGPSWPHLLGMWPPGWTLTISSSCLRTFAPTVPEPRGLRYAHGSVTCVGRCSHVTLSVRPPWTQLTCHLPVMVSPTPLPLIFAPPSHRLQSTHIRNDVFV